MPHRAYYELTASSHRQLGVQKGALFAPLLRQAVDELKQDAFSVEAEARSKEHLNITRRALPHLIEELEGCAEGSGIPLHDLWVLTMEDELFAPAAERCTTIVANHGLLVAHNEDWTEEADDAICVLRRTVADLTTLELFYWGTLGGNSCSVSSSGVVQAVNTLYHTGWRPGVPRNLVARWLSDSRAVGRDIEKVSDMQRSAGYSHTLVTTRKEVYNIECTAEQYRLVRPALPFVHTNHFLTDLRRFEAACTCESLTRHAFASARVRSTMSVDAAAALLDQSPLRNDRTVARALVDLGKARAWIWLRREAQRGWVEYDIGFVKTKHAA